MMNNNNLNPNHSISKTENYAAELGVIAGTITTIGEEMKDIADSFKKLQIESNIKAIKNMQKQIEFLTSELKEIKKMMK